MSKVSYISISFSSIDANILNKTQETESSSKVNRSCVITKWIYLNKPGKNIKDFYFCILYPIAADCIRNISETSCYFFVILKSSPPIYIFMKKTFCFWRRKWEERLFKTNLFNKSLCFLENNWTFFLLLQWPYCYVILVEVYGENPAHRKEQSMVITFFCNCGCFSVILLKPDKQKFFAMWNLRQINQFLCPVTLKFSSLFCTLNDKSFSHVWNSNILHWSFKNIGSLSFTDIPNLDTFYFKISKNCLY